MVSLEVDLHAVVTTFVHVGVISQIPMMVITMHHRHLGHEILPLLIFFTRGCSGVDLGNAPQLLLRCQRKHTKASPKGDIVWRACPGKHVHHEVGCLRKPSKRASTVHFYRAVLNTVQNAQSCTHSSVCMHALELLSSQ